MTRFSKKLRQVMQEQGATIRSISAKSGLPEDHIWNFLQERAVPKGEVTRRIARALGVSDHALTSTRPPPRIREASSLAAGGGPGDLSAKTPRKDAAPAPRGLNPIQRADIRQRGLLRILVEKGIFTKAEWEAKLSEVVESHRRRRG